jgi:hypothetical protein
MTFTFNLNITGYGMMMDLKSYIDRLFEGVVDNSSSCDRTCFRATPSETEVHLSHE